MKKKTFGTNGAVVAVVDDNSSITINVVKKPTQEAMVAAGEWLTVEQQNATAPKPGNRYAGVPSINGATFTLKYPSPKAEKIETVTVTYAKWADDMVKNFKEESKPDNSKKDNDQNQKKSDEKKDDQKKDEKKDDQKKDEKKDDQKASEKMPWELENPEKHWEDQFKAYLAKM